LIAQLFDARSEDGKTCSGQVFVLATSHRRICQQSSLIVEPYKTYEAPKTSQARPNIVENTFIVAFTASLRKMTNFNINIVSDTICRKSTQLGKVEKLTCRSMVLCWQEATREGNRSVQREAPRRQ
jgi:hypothetical protein